MPRTSASAEPPKDLLAQFADAADTKTKRQGVFLSTANLESLKNDTSPDAAQVKVLVKNAQGSGRMTKVPGGGVLVMPDVGSALKAKTELASGSDPQTVIGRITGAGEGKTPEQTAVVQGHTPEGAVATESMVKPEEVPAKVAEVAAEGKKPVVTTPIAAQVRRQMGIAQVGKSEVAVQIEPGAPEGMTRVRPIDEQGEPGALTHDIPSGKVRNAESKPAAEAESKPATSKSPTESEPALVKPESKPVVIAEGEKPPAPIAEPGSPSGEAPSAGAEPPLATALAEHQSQEEIPPGKSFAAPLAERQDNASSFAGALLAASKEAQGKAPDAAIERANKAAKAAINLTSKYAVSFSTQQLVAVLLIVLLTWINTRGLKLGKWIQNIFTSTKTLSLIALILIGLFFGRNAEAIKTNFTDFWTPRGVSPIKPNLPFIATVTAASGAFDLFIAFCVAQVGSLFSSDAWNNITFTAGEVKEPRRNIPLSLAGGTALVTMLYVLANVAYLCMLPLDKIQSAPDDRVATAAIETVFKGAGPVIMAVAIMISTFGCNNGLILAGARVYYAMARDGLFFRATGKLNERRVPAMGLVLQCIWTCLLVLPRTRLRDPTGAPRLDSGGHELYGNLYSDLLDYVVFAVLIFYVLTIIGLFVLRRKQPNVERPYRAFGYPIVPALYIIAASIIMLVLLLYKTDTSWPGLLIVALGVPVYFLWNRRS